MRLDVEAKWSVQVCGDWHTVIGLREYRDDLIDQKPYDEDDAEYGIYTIPCADMDAIRKALDACHEKHLYAYVAVEINHEHLELSLCSGDGYSRENKPCSRVIIKETSKARRDMIDEAIDLLHKARL